MICSEGNIDRFLAPNKELDNFVEDEDFNYDAELDLDDGQLIFRSCSFEQSVFFLLLVVVCFTLKKYCHLSFRLIFMIV